MRTLSFENLRRLVGRRKDRDEPSFERSESFKRISIRKSYLDRGKRRTRLQKINDESKPAPAPVVTVEVSSRTRTKSVVGPTIVQVRGSSANSSDLDEKKEKRISRDDIEVIKVGDPDDDYEDEKKVRRDTPAGTIVYGQWINDVDSSYSSKERKCTVDSFSSHDSKLNVHSSREKVCVTQENQRAFIKRNLALSPTRKTEDADNRKISSVIIELDQSPKFPRFKIQNRDERNVDNHEQKRNVQKDCNYVNVTTVNVGSRDWKNSINVPAATSYSLPTTQVSESHTEEKLNSRIISIPDKTPSVNNNNNNKTDTSSTRASGFSLSLSFSRLTTDIRAAALTTKNGLFRRRKRPAPMKPAPSVSAEGYFERTAAASVSTRRSRRSVAVGSGRRKPNYASRRRKMSGNKPSPPPGSPVWFVPPERRRSSRQRGRVWREVRYLPQEEGKSDGDNVDNRSNDWSNDSNLSDEFDDKKLLLSGDFDEKSEASLNPRKVDSGSTLDSSSLISSAASSVCIKPKISDFNEEKIFYEEYRGHKSKPATKPTVSNVNCNYFASTQFLGFVAKSAGRSTSRLAIHNQLRDYTSSSSGTSETEPDNTDQRRVLLVVGGNKKDSKDSVASNSQEVTSGKDRRNCSVVLVLEGHQRSSNTPVNRSQELSAGQRRRPLRRKSQLVRGNGRGQPVYLARRRSSLRRKPCSKDKF